MRWLRILRIRSNSKLYPSIRVNVLDGEFIGSRVRSKTTEQVPSTSRKIKKSINGYSTGGYIKSGSYLRL